MIFKLVQLIILPLKKMLKKKKYKMICLTYLNLFFKINKK